MGMNLLFGLKTVNMAMFEFIVPSRLCIVH